MGLSGEFIKGISNFLENNPLAVGAIATAAFWLLGNLFGGSSTFNRAVKAGGAGLAVSIASAVFSPGGIGQLIPKFVEDAISRPSPEI